MPDNIAPRRDETLILKGGLPTARFAEYLERMTADVNASSNINVVAEESINASVGSQATLSKRIDALENDVTQPLINIDDRVEGLENTIFALQAKFAVLQKQINSLQVESLL